jgi:hypothetical protein
MCVGVCVYFLLVCFVIKLPTVAVERRADEEGVSSAPRALQRQPA